MAEPGIVFMDEPVTDELPAPLFLPYDKALLAVEYQQLIDEGKALTTLDYDIETHLSNDDPVTAPTVKTILDDTETLPVRDAFPYTEPTTLQAIQAASPPSPLADEPLPAATATDAIHGGWLGACAGCLLGKPVQGWSRARINDYLEASDQAPLTAYIHADVSPEIADRYAIHTNLEPIDAFIDEVSGMPIDDDIDYIVVGLIALQDHGSDIDSTDIASTWLSTLPVFNTYTAERVAYRNLTNLILPPDSATYRNPYREMIGALIRADPWGYAAMGNPTSAAALAHRDARISHVKNGVYGEMWAAAMIAAAPLTTKVETIIDAGLAELPSNCRLADAVTTVIEWHDHGHSYEAVADRIHDRWDETSIYDWVHTIPNAQIITAALLYSDGEFGTAVCKAVETGFDTDSHAATIGSIMGAFLGESDLPDAWTAPLNDSLATSLPGYGHASISDLAVATADVWSTLNADAST